MGVSYNGQLCVGYKYDQLEQIVEEFGNGDIEDYEQLGFEMFQPHYDADREDSIFGVSVVSTDSYSYGVVTDSKLAKASILKQKLYHKYLVTPFVYIMAEGS